MQILKNIAYVATYVLRVVAITVFAILLYYHASTDFAIFASVLVAYIGFGFGSELLERWEIRNTLIDSNGRTAGADIHAFGGGGDISDVRPIDHVHFSIVAPESVRPREQFVLSVWAFHNYYRGKIKEIAKNQAAKQIGLKGPIKVKQGSDLYVALSLNKFSIDFPEDVIHWNGTIAKVSFAVRIPEIIPAGRHTGHARIFYAGICIARIFFEILVGEGKKNQIGILPGHCERVRSVFCSYARADFSKVIQWARGAAFAGVETFIDVISLRSGQDWQRELKKEISSHDLFCLFWSRAANRSKWVDFEWRYALELKGCKYIYPVPLCDPQSVPPPSELRDCLHFDDISRIVLDYQKLFKRNRLIWGICMIGGVACFIVLEGACLIIFVLKLVELFQR